MKFFIFLILIFVPLPTILSAKLNNFETKFGDLAVQKTLTKSARILGGTAIATINIVPYIVRLASTAKNGRILYCGGSIIHSQFILTAAHCLFGREESMIFMGTININLPNHGKSIHVPKSAYNIHELFNPMKYTNDVALIQVPTIKFTNEIQPIALITKADSIPLTKFDNQLVKICGWGRLSDTQVSDYLYCAIVNILPEKLCQQSYGSIITPKTICQSGGDRRGTCEGDSGGPMTTTNSNNQTMLIGVTSFGATIGCNNTAPRVFSRVSEYLDWIQKNTT